MRQLTLCRVCFTLAHCGHQLSTRRVAGALRDRQESEGAAGPAQTLQKGDGCAPCCNGALRPEHAGLECAPIEGQSRGPARDGSQWPLAHHVPLGRQGRRRAGSRAVSLNERTTMATTKTTKGLPVRQPLKREPTHPGEILREDVLPALRMNVSQAARELGVSRQLLHRILAGRAPVTPEMAVRLGKWAGNGPGAVARDAAGF